MVIMNTEMQRRFIVPLVRGLVLCFLVSSGLASAAAINEVEPNDTLLSAQPIYVPAEGTSVSAVIGELNGPWNADVDFFTFDGTQGDVPSIATVGALNPDAPGSCLGFPANLALYDAAGTMVAMASGDCFAGTEAFINSYTLPATGTYTIGVSAWNFHALNDGGAMDNPDLLYTGGPYLLVVNGVRDSSPPPTPVPTPTPPPTLPPPSPAMHVPIEIRHWHQDEVGLGKRHGKDPITVVILSMADFDARSVDPSSLTFGRTGEEDSLFRCRKESKDVNHDGLPDLVCYFKPDVADFQPGNLMGNLHGRIKATGEQIEGSAALKIFTRKEQKGFKHGPKQGSEGDDRKNGKNKK
jgi:hypothetical protein